MFFVVLSLTGTKRNINCAPGETLKVPLDGIKLEYATLFFNGNGSIVTLVNSGEPVASRDPNYINRLKVTSETIHLLNVNVSDWGEYILKDQNRQIVSKSTLILVGKNHIKSKML